MGQTLFDDELTERRLSFVGRIRERKAWAAMLTQRTKQRIMHLHGPGGIGKTALLHAFARDAESRKIPVVYLDARDVTPSRQGIANLVASAGLGRKSSRLRAVLIDTSERLAAVEDLFCAELLSHTGPNDRVVVASRLTPGLPWRKLAVYGSSVFAMKLGGVSTSDASAYLARRNVAVSDRPRIIAFADGYPLALALAAEDGESNPGRGGVRAFASPEVVELLCRSFLEGVDDRRRRAFELAALVRSTTEDLLAVAFPDDDARETFAWLRSLSFVEANADGLFPHDLARDAVAADLRWRSPSRWRELLELAFRYYVPRVQSGPRAAVMKAFVDFGFLTRQVPGMAGAFEVPATLDLTRDIARPRDLEALAAMISSHESPEAVAALRHWFARQPEAFQVLRDEGGAPVAFVGILELHETTPADRRRDPTIEMVHRHARALLGRRKRASILYVRFMVGAEEYQTPSPVVAALAVFSAEPLLLGTDLALFYHYFADWPAWEGPVTFAGARLAPELAFELGGKRYDVALHDRRDAPSSAWMLEVVGRALAMTAAAAPASAPAAQGEAGARVGSKDSSPGFARDVRAALRALHDVDALAKSPLAASVSGAPADAHAAGAAVRRALLEAIAALEGTSKGDRLFSAIKLAYVEPAVSQEHAAEVLGVGFSTYKRHLDAAVARVVASLRA
jgi:hypothetical protein